MHVCCVLCRRQTSPCWTIVTTAAVTANHAWMVWDTLFGVDVAQRPKPQMAEGYTISDRAGLRHDTGVEGRAAFLKLSGQALQTAPQRWARAAFSSLL